jgi:hypothetical protein
MLRHDLFKRPFHPHHPSRRWHGAKREICEIVFARGIGGIVSHLCREAHPSGPTEVLVVNIPRCVGC